MDSYAEEDEVDLIISVEGSQLSVLVLTGGGWIGVCNKDMSLEAIEIPEHDMH